MSINAVAGPPAAVRARTERLKNWWKGFIFYPPAALLLAWFAQSSVLSQAPRQIGVLLRIPSGVFAIWMIYLSCSTAYRLLVFAVQWVVARSELVRDDFRLALLHLARLPLYVVLFWWLASASSWWGLRPSSTLPTEPTSKGRPSTVGDAAPPARR